MKNQETFDDEIDLKEFFSILWQGKYRIILTTTIASILSVYLALSLPNIYKSEATLASVSGGGNPLDGISGQMGGLANLAGISLPSASTSDKSIIGIEVLQSRKFFEDFLKNNDNVLLPLMASKGWDSELNQVIIDEEIYDIENNKWIENKNYLKGSKPSTQQAFKSFSGNFSVSKNKLTGFITISIKHFSPYIAKEWLDKVINQINESIRQEDIAKAERSIGYLKSEIEISQVTKIQNSLYNLIQNQVEKKVLAQATPEYVFQIVDPPIVPELKESPRRSIICIIGALLGAILGTFLVLIQHYFFKKII